MLNTITLSNVKYASFKRHKFELVKGKYDFKDGFISVCKDYIEYQPFDIPDLYIKFAKLNPNNKEEILNFINNYGNIGIYDENSNSYFEKWRYWREEIIKMKQCLILLKLYNRQNIKYSFEKLHKKEKEILKDTALYEYLKEDSIPLCIFSISDKKCSNCGECKDFPEKYSPPSEEEVFNQKNFDLRYSCLLDLQGFVKGNIGKISFSPLIDIDVDGKPCLKASIEFPSLLSIMYWQLYLSFFENERFFTCEGCNRVLPWSKNKKNYLCYKCYERTKYNQRSNKTKTNKHDSFGRKTRYYISNQYHFASKDSKNKLKILREQIMENSRYKKEKLNKDAYLKWLNKQENLFMKQVEKYREEV